MKDLKFSNVNQKAAKSENSKTQPGEVIKISPQEGETVPLDTKITVTYATGKSDVPNFDGLSRSAAIRQANEAGFGDPVFVEKETSKGTARDRDLPEPAGWCQRRSRYHHPTHPGRAAATADHTATDHRATDQTTTDNETAYTYADPNQDEDSF